MKIDVKELTFVYPAEETPNGTLWLSDSDLVHGPAHMNTVHFYEPMSNTNGDRNVVAEEVVRILKESLSKVLVPFFPVAGRLGKGENGRIEIKCNGQGVMFTLAETDSTMDELRNVGFAPNSEVAQLVTKVDYSKDMSSYPLLVILVTLFRCGGISIGVGLHHFLADGRSASDFINSWASIARGLPIIAPLHDRTLLSDRSLPSPIFLHPEFETIPLHKSSSTSNSTAHLKVSLDMLKALEGKARNEKYGRNYSSYQLLTAHIWRCACKARALTHDQTTSLYMSVDVRSRIRPHIPQHLFGNVVLPISPVALAGDVIKESLSCTADRIYKAIKEVDDKYVRSSLAFIHQNLDALEGIMGKPRSGNPNLGITSWTHMPFQNIDFGWGPPTHVGPATMLIEGKGYVMSSDKGDGSLSLSLCLETEHMQLFEKLFYEF